MAKVTQVPEWAKIYESQEKVSLTERLNHFHLKNIAPAAQKNDTKVKDQNNNAEDAKDVRHVKDFKDVKDAKDAKGAKDVDVESRPSHSLLINLIRQGLQDVSSNFTIQVERKDPSSPLYSVKSFENLHLKDELLKGIYRLGFTSPSRIQETALPALLADPPQNMIAQSQNGTGKTVAFVLAMLSRVDTTLDHPQVLCMAPTYELAIQIGEVAREMAYFCPEIRILYAVRGEERYEKIDHHIIIGTPGKLLDWALKYKLFDIGKIKVFVLDEADVMISLQGHQDQCVRVHKKLNQKECQMLLFSATFDNAVMEFAEYIVSKPIIIRLQRSEEALNNVRHYIVKCKNDKDKYVAIQNIYAGICVGQAIFFCHTRKSAAWLAAKLSEDGHAVALLSGELNVDQRLAILDRFRSGMEKVLITTNVLSRGIDVEQVTIVVNFDIPLDGEGKADCETYLHRIGRTGRFGKKGIAINLVDTPRSIEDCKIIEKHFQIKINQLNTNDYDEVEKMQDSW